MGDRVNWLILPHSYLIFPMTVETVINWKETIYHALVIDN